jgi:ATP-dependent helicase/nuclease subunit A
MQGVMDCIFFEKDGWILIDYKTDKLRSGDALDEVKSRYELQIRLYCEAISKILKQPVKEAYLYLFDGAQVVRMA